jgi:2-methylcitrate dehydratase PrpD
MIQVIIEHSPTSVFNSAHASRTAVVAARAATGGMHGLRLGLEGARGLFAAVAPEANPNDVMNSPTQWALTAVALRPYATTGYAQTAVEAALKLTPIEAAGVEKIEIVAPPGAAGIAGGTAPDGPVERWWSIPYAVGVCLISGEAAALEELSWAEDQQLARFLSITSVSPRSDAPSDDLTTKITLTIDGSIASESASVHLGHPATPLDDDVRLAKWAAMLPGAAPDQAQTVLALCRDATSHSTVEVVREINHVLVGTTG